MNKLRFDRNDIEGVILEDKKYMLLYYFISSQYPFEEMIEEMKTVQSGEKTFEEMYEGYAVLSVGQGAGELEYDKDTARFISNDENTEPSMEMPLQELIDLMTEWVAFKKKHGRDDWQY